MMNSTSSVGGACSNAGFTQNLFHSRHVKCEKVTNRLDELHESTRASTMQVRAVIVSCARNVEKDLKSSLAFLTGLGKHTSAFSVVIYEDSSTDGTRDQLRRWVTSGHSTHAKTAFFADPLMRATRTQRLALCRNTIMHEAFSSSRISRTRGSKLPTIMVAVDLDCPHVLERVLPGFRDALGAMQPPESARFEVLTANSYPSYYDLWTIRSKQLLIDYDCWVGDACSRTAQLPAEHCSPRPVGDPECVCAAGKEQVRRRGNCQSYQIFISPAAPLFAVEGGYSGLTLYNADAVERTGCTFNGDERCEIVPFQACLRSRQLRIGLVPSLLQGCGAEHTLAANRTMLGKPRQNVFMSDKGAITYATRIQK